MARGQPSIRGKHIPVGGVNIWRKALRETVHAIVRPSSPIDRGPPVRIRQLEFVDVEIELAIHAADFERDRV